MQEIDLFFVSLLESGLTFVSTIKPDSRRDTVIVRNMLRSIWNPL